MKTIRDFINIINEANKAPIVWYNPFREACISFESHLDEDVYRRFVVDLANGEIEPTTDIEVDKLVPAGTLKGYYKVPDDILGADGVEPQDFLDKLEAVLQPFYVDVENQEDELPDEPYLAVVFGNGNGYWFEGADDYEFFEKLCSEVGIRFTVLGGWKDEKLVPDGTLKDFYDADSASFEAIYYEVDSILKPYLSNFRYR